MRQDWLRHKHLPLDEFKELINEAAYVSMGFHYYPEYLHHRQTDHEHSRPLG
jgi:hypothetical protein